MKDKKIDISIIIPVYNEQDSLLQLFNEISTNINSKYDYEIIFINDGSTDQSKDIILDLIKKHSNLKLIDHLKNYGKSEALNAGFKLSIGEIIITLDADLQDDPKEILKFINKIEEGYGLISGWKKNRLDPLSKKIASKIFNVILRFISNIKIHDFNCGYKAYSRVAIENVEIYGGLHRFMPIIVKNNGFSVAEIIVNHRKRKFGKSKYSSSRISHGFFDLITLLFFNRYLTRPLHFFGIIGVIIFLIGFVISMNFTINWFYGTWITPYKNPLFFLGILLLIIGAQFFSIGLVGELIVKYNKKRNNNSVRYYNFDE